MTTQYYLCEKHRLRFSGNKSVALHSILLKIRKILTQKERGRETDKTGLLDSCLTLTGSCKSEAIFLAREEKQIHYLKCGFQKEVKIETKTYWKRTRLLRERRRDGERIDWEQNGNELTSFPRPPHEDLRRHPAQRSRPKPRSSSDTLRLAEIDHLHVPVVIQDEVCWLILWVKRRYQQRAQRERYTC